MIPARFDTEAERQTYFRDMRARVEDEAAAALEQINRTCVDEACELGHQQVRELKQQKLDELERKEMLTTAG
jgi:hypothetical protein